MRKIDQVNSRRKAIRMRRHAQRQKRLFTRPPRSGYTSTAAPSFLAMMFRNTTALQNLQRQEALNKRIEKEQRRATRKTQAR